MSSLGRAVEAGSPLKKLHLSVSQSLASSDCSKAARGSTLETWFCHSCGVEIESSSNPFGTAHRAAHDSCF
jgi:hypothetical protein